MQFLDTDVMVDIFRRYPPSLRWLESLAERPHLPGIVVMELLKGCRSASEVRNVHQRIDSFAVRWSSEYECARLLMIFGDKHLSHNLGIPDALIAACALAHDAVLYSFNIRHFRAIPRLRIEQPAYR